MAVAFAITYYGVRPCTMLNMDFLYSFLVIVICWLVWDTLTYHSGRAGRYVLAGFLVSLACLFKYSGIIFGAAAIASIVLYFSREHRDLGQGLKMAAWLLLGAVPLLMAYQLLLERPGQGQNPSIGTYAFYDGTYLSQGGLDYREERMSEINAGGTQYSHVERIRSSNEFDYSLKHPSQMVHKFLWGFNVTSQDVTFSILPGGDISDTKITRLGPQGKQLLELLKGNGWSGIVREVSPSEVQVNRDRFLTEADVRSTVGNDFDKVWKVLSRSNSRRIFINRLFQGAFLLLLFISAWHYRWSFDLMHVIFFAFGMVLIPLCLVQERYLWPFMPLYFVLWLFILNAGYQALDKEIKDKTFLKVMGIILLGVFLAVCTTKTTKQIGRLRLYYNQEVHRNQAWDEAASWLKEDAKALGHPPKIMSSDNFLSYLTHAQYTRLPFVIPSWKRLLDFALLKKVDYLVIESDHSPSFFSFTADEFQKGLTPQALLAALKDAGQHQSPKPALQRLNELLEDRDLYQRLPVWPKGTERYIQQLQENGFLLPLALKQLNRRLIEANRPQESPHKLFLDPARGGPVAMIQEINGQDVTFWIFKLNSSG